MILISFFDSVDLSQSAQVKNEELCLRFAEKGST